MTTFSIVDDDAVLRKKIILYLHATHKFRCVSNHATAAEALTTLPQLRPEIVLMDINLGAVSGIECVQELKPQLPATDFLMLTVFEDTEKIFQALAAGACGYLLKRRPPRELLEALNEVLTGGAPMSAPIARKVVASFQAKPAAQSEMIHLSEREQEVLDGLAKGYAYKQIADQLNVKMDTIRTYIRRIYEKLQVHDKAQAVAKFRGQS